VYNSYGDREWGSFIKDVEMVMAFALHSTHGHDVGNSTTPPRNVEL
jgi:hypothetical protein